MIISGTIAIFVAPLDLFTSDPFWITVGFGLHGAFGPLPTYAQEFYTHAPVELSGRGQRCDTLKSSNARRRLAASATWCGKFGIIASLARARPGARGNNNREGASP
jgi:hypothetical protein